MTTHISSMESSPSTSSLSPVDNDPEFNEECIAKTEECSLNDDDLNEDVSQLRENIRQLQIEVDEARSLVAVANYSLEESIATERRKCKEEVATLQQLMKENEQEIQRKTQERFEGEIRRLKNLVTRLELEIQELRSADKDPNVFSAVTKTLVRKVGNLANSSLVASQSTNQTVIEPTEEKGYLEQSMKKAQEDAEMLKSLVLPLEEEIAALKDKLRNADDLLRVYEANQAKLISGTQLLIKMAEEKPITDVFSELIAKAKETSENSSDIEIFLAALNAERVTLQEERERLRIQLQEACQLLENERRQHRELRRTWQQANDQFLEAQNFHVKDLQHLQGLLTPQQLKQLEDLRGQDSIKENNSEKLPMKGFPIKEKLSLSPLFNRISPVLKRRSPVHSPQKESSHDAVSSDALDGSELGTSLPDYGSKVVTNRELIDEETRNGKDVPLLQINTVKEETSHVWDEHREQLEYEVQQLKEDKLQLEKQLVKAGEEAERMSNLVRDMERKWTDLAKDYEKQVTALFGQIESLQEQLHSVHIAFSKFRNEAKDSLQKLYFDRESVDKEIVRLQEENDFLVGKHSAHAEQLQNEIIDLPDNIQELQYVLLNMREDLIAAKVAKEAAEKKFQSEILFLKDQLLTEQQSKESLENTLSREINYLREQLGIMRSVHTQLDEETSRIASLETALQRAKEQWSEAQQRATEAIIAKTKIEAEVQQLKNRVSSLQADLETSEAVQRDFVQLSQQLQVQLEKIRQSEKELRWQFEEDVDNCAECRQLFTVTKRKHHCRHCGQIFCSECLRKTVTSGPNKRPARVCNVCYYLLVQDSAPFFSSEPQLS